MGTAFLATEHLPVTPLWNAAGRVLPAGLALLAVRPARPRGVWWTRALALGLVNFGAFFTLQAFAAHRLPGAVVATISAMQTLLVPVLVLALGERVRMRQLAAGLLGVAGVALVVLRGSTHLDRLGVLAAAALAFLAAFGLLLTRRWAVPTGTHPLSAIAWQLLAGGLILLPMAFATEGLPAAMTWGEAAAAAWLALAATAAAFALFFGGLYRGIPATTASRLLLLGPVAAAAAGWLFAHETLSALQLLGVLLVCIAQFADKWPPRVRIARSRSTRALFMKVVDTALRGVRVSRGERAIR